MSSIARAVRTVAAGDGVYDGTVVERITRHLLTGGRASSSAIFPSSVTVNATSSP